MGFSGTNNAKRYEYIYDSTGRRVGMNTIPATVTSSATLSANVGSSSQIRFYYDNDTNRVKLINKAGDVYYFVYDPTASIPSVVYEAVNNSETATTYLNVREPDGSLISRDKYEGISLIQSRTYHFDGLGSTLSLTDEDGDVIDTYTYDAWGNVTNHTGSTTDNPYQYVGKFGYYTHYQEPTFGLLQLGVRYYDSTIGRFTQRDPIAHLSSMYSYTDGRPMTSIDPSGKVVLQIGIGLVVAAIVLDVKCAANAFLVGNEYRESPNNAIGRVNHFMAHCMASCLVTRCIPRAPLTCGAFGMAAALVGIDARSVIGRSQALFAGFLLELFQATPVGKPDGKGWGNKYWVTNMGWNMEGANCGLSNGTCFQCCMGRAKALHQWNE
jgi:RHS repeat-associated protein